MNHSLREVKDLAQEAYRIIKWETEVNPNNTAQSFLKHSNSIRDAVEIVESLEIFEDEVKALKSSELYTNSGDSIKIPTAAASTIAGMAQSLEQLLKNFYKALETVLPAESPNSINIKLPTVNDFNDLSSYAKDLDTALSQVMYLNEIDSKVKIESVENGSIWLNVLLDTVFAVSVVGGLVWSAAVIYKKILEGRIMDEQLRGLKIRTDSMEDVSKAQKESLLQLVQAEADFINSTTFKENVPENIERIKVSIKLFAELLDKGAEVHPAIGAPEEVTNLYPNMKALPTVESKTKLLS